MFVECVFVLFYSYESTRLFIIKIKIGQSRCVNSSFLNWQYLEVEIGLHFLLKQKSIGHVQINLLSFAKKSREYEYLNFNY